MENFGFDSSPFLEKLPYNEFDMETSAFDSSFALEKLSSYNELDMGTSALVSGSSIGLEMLSYKELDMETSSFGSYKELDREAFPFNPFVADLEKLSNRKEDNDSIKADTKAKRYAHHKLNQVEEEPLVVSKDDDDADYNLIKFFVCRLIAIDEEIVTVHNIIRDKYIVKFPELEKLVPRPIDYARVVKKIGNEMDLRLVDLEGLLPSGVVMAVKITALTSRGKPLAEDVMRKTIDACDRVLSLDVERKKVLDSVEINMGSLARKKVLDIVASADGDKLKVGNFFL